MIWSGRCSLNQLFEIQPLGLHGSGQMVQFQQIFRLKHLISNQYLCIDDQDQIILDSHSNRAYAYFAAHRRSTVAKRDQHLAYNTPLYILTSNNTVFKYNQEGEQSVQDQPAVVGDRNAKQAQVSMEMVTVPSETIHNCWLISHLKLTIANFHLKQTSENRSQLMQQLVFLCAHLASHPNLPHIQKTFKDNDILEVINDFLAHT